MPSTDHHRRGLAGFLNRRFLWLLLGAYTAAAVFPAGGRWLRALALPTGAGAPVPLPEVLLGVLLFAAGLGVSPERLRGVLARPGLLLAGLAASFAVPLAFLAAVGPALRLWPDPAQGEAVILGLALIAALPVAGSSTAWAQRAQADVALSLGLVVLSTVLSPLVTPAVLRAAAWLAPAAGELARQIGPGTGEFLAEWVALPSLLGMLARRLAGEARSAAAGPAVGCVSGLVLLVLCYANAASCLPRAVLGPSWAFLGLTAVAVVGLCALSFAAGLGLGRLARADAPQRASLAFGLGMSNNGTGLVLASAALTEFPQAMLPLVLYTLVQHLGAGAVEALLRRETEPAEETSGPIGWSLVPSATPAD